MNPQLQQAGFSLNACGVLSEGFLMARCDACGHDRLVAFSCKGRGMCSSCGGRRMADTAAWLRNEVLRGMPVRASG
ncbi:transposase zinc-binding domain-containing protein [Myxococcota bacterium]|nr:transposase zinc-binding domain-containing protein [Myxococcota bacterium]